MRWSLPRISVSVSLRWTRKTSVTLVFRLALS